jgi:HAMP domain-containing protein/CheY-like chemotaxis protein/signal transduction histidine kinase
VSVGERPELPEQEKPPAEGRGNGRSTSGSARGKRGRPRRAAASASNGDLDTMEEGSSRGGVMTENGGGDGGSVPRERAMRRLLAGLRAIDAGDFTIRLEPVGDPLMAEIADIFNSVATKQGRLADELNRVALSVGREGKMRDRATIGPAGGLWAGSVDALNSLITDLVQPTSEVARVIKAVAEGDLSQKVELEIEGKTVQGEFFRIGSTVNRMVDQLNAFASEVTRVAREVGTEGRLGGQANVQGVSGTWRDLTDSVNGMATNLTNQVRNIADVTTAVAKGDLSKKITAEAKGEILELKNTINTMVDQLSSFADEVTRVAREVGTEGVLGGQANVPGVAGTWKDLTDSVNGMASNLTNQVRNIADVTTAVAKGDLGRKITAEAKGEILELKNTINTMVDQLSSFAAEVTRVAREVGTEGVLGGQANVSGVAGTWKDLTDSVNFMASNLTSQVRNIADVTTAVAKGDLSRKITAEAKGEILELKNTVNTMVDQLNGFASEVTRVAREVGTEGILGGQANVQGVSGTWKDLTDSVNYMAGNLTSQVRNIALVTTAVANGDLSQKITVEAKGEVLELKNTVNTMVDQLNSFAAEVTRVAREVGSEGRLGGQANVPGVAGTWKDLTDSVNFMAGNLTSQVRNIADVTTAVARGDLSLKITAEAKGEILELKTIINTMVDQLNAFAAEVTRVAREVGTEGRLGGQANVEGVSGTWRDLTDSVNSMASNLTSQVRNIADVTTAVAKGDLSRKITAEAKGEVLELKNTVNTMVDQLNAFAAEVTRVAREVGTEGVLGGQANVPGVAGTWKDLTDSVNGMASNLTNQVRNIADVTTAVAKGDLSKKITAEAKGEMLELKSTVNTMVDQLRSFADEVTRVAREVGTEGRLGGQANVPGVAGTWKDLTDSVNYMASNLTSQVRNIADVTTAVALGDLSRKITVDARGEILELKNTVNTMVEQLNSFASEVTRVAREVGSEGILGGQARVPGAGGVWRDLTDNVNFMASNLTSQVRNIALVTTAVANGDLSQKITVEARGEMLELKNTVNTMVEKLRVFADEVTRVAKEVGTEGKLGGQAEVPGVVGTWKALTDSVNAMANSLTAQVRNIADVATAVTKGDLTRQITVEAQGELDELKSNINQMIANLKETTERNQEQDWLKTNLAKFSRMMQGQKDLESVSRLIMSELTPLVSAHHGAFFIMDQEAGMPNLRLIASYAYRARKHVGNRFAVGEGLVGQAALEKQPILLQNVPDDYIQITSGLGEAPPRNIIVLPVLFEGEVKAVIELASFLPFSQIHQTFLDQLAESIGVVLNMIGASMRTEELLEQSQKLTQELQSQSKELQQQQDELKRSNTELEAQAKTLRQSEELLKEQQEELQQVNEELEEKASLLAEQNQKVEQKNREVEGARLALEEKAEQLAVSSKYKSEFLANMSHELRTPLNSLLILAKLLSDNKERNLTPKQVEFSQTIYSSGTDLLNLINDILDLSKVEAGKMELDPAEVPVQDVAAFSHRTFDPVAQQKGLSFTVDIQPGVPQSIYTDGQRLQQVLKNLLSNALKFTERGSVTLTIRKADKGKRFASRSLDSAETVIAFAVEDTGIGIAKDKQQLIFESFQQADGTTSRKFGGTGLGLTISREIARLLGGEIRVDSTPGRGSTFTLFLPARYIEPETPRGDDGGPARRRERSDRNDRSDRGDRGDSWSNAESGNSWSRPQSSRPAPEPRRLPPSTAEAGGWERGSSGAAVAEAPRAVEEDYDQPMSRDALPRPDGFDDDRDSIDEGDRVLLIVENDANFCKILLEMAREKGFKGLAAMDGEAGLKLAHAFEPDAITLDIDMPGMDGWAVLDRLKHHPQTRHIPVHIITGVRERQQGLKSGALAYLEKPVTKEALDDSFAKISSFIDKSVRRLLVVEDDAKQREAMIELIQHEDVEITAVATAEDALRELSTGHFDCMVLDLGLQGVSGFELLETVKANPQVADLPIIIYTGKELSQAEDTKLRKFAETIIVKDVKSPERLLDETALFLHRVEAKLPEQKRRMLERLHNTDAVFAGKRVLIVDDDVRNIFSLTSMLEDHGMQVSFAENGKDAVALLRERQDFDLVLMDIMMPEMDGYETTRAIRQVPALKSLPIIALTAKAMKGDREKTIAAGASDYITKPVDTDQLLSLMRVWLYR